MNHNLKFQFILQYSEAIFMELDGFLTFPHQDPLELSYLVLKSPPSFPHLPPPKSVISAQY